MTEPTEATAPGLAGATAPAAAMSLAMRVFDLGTDEDVCLITTELVDGGTLRALPGSRLAHQEVVEIGR